MPFDTIAAIATPSGVGSVAMIRVSGKEAIEICDKVFCSSNGEKLCEKPGYTALYGNTYDKDRLIDETVALLFREPKSFTGEDVVELTVHGGEFVAKELLTALLSAGARLAMAGEFSRRAFQNGKMDITKAESITEIIAADSRQTLALANAARKGKTAQAINTVKELLLTAASDLAALCDYPDEDIPGLSEENIKSTVKSAADNLSKMLCDFDCGQMLRSGIITVIAGSPNAGKSTLMNVLTGNERSIVTKVAGTTRDVIEETVTLSDVKLRLCDTAGLRSAIDEVEKIGVDLALNKLDEAQLILGVFDADKKPGEYDKKLIEIMKSKPSIAVINKIDLNDNPDKTLFSDIKTVEISAKDKIGLECLSQAILKVVGADNLNPDTAVLISERQRDCALRARDALCDALSAFDNGMTADAAGVCVDDALSALLELTGERVTNAVTDEVFKRFCVGK